jgi:putative transposon-encoded protein
MAADTKNVKQDGGIKLGSVRFEVHGEELLTKQVRQSGNSGRIYLPPTWVGKRVKIVRLD